MSTTDPAAPQVLPDDLAFLHAALSDYQAAFERILALHGPTAARGPTCKQCARPWPCPTTIAALAPHRTEHGQ